MKTAIHLATYIVLGATIVAPVLGAPLDVCAVAGGAMTIVTGLFSVFG